MVVEVAARHNAWRDRSHSDPLQASVDFLDTFFDSVDQATIGLAKLGQEEGPRQRRAGRPRSKTPVPASRIKRLMESAQLAWPSSPLERGLVDEELLDLDSQEGPWLACSPKVVGGGASALPAFCLSPAAVNLSSSTEQPSSGAATEESSTTASDSSPAPGALQRPAPGGRFLAKKRAEQLAAGGASGGGAAQPARGRPATPRGPRAATPRGPRAATPGPRPAAEAAAVQGPAHSAAAAEPGPAAHRPLHGLARNAPPLSARRSGGALEPGRLVAVKGAPGRPSGEVCRARILTVDQETASCKVRLRSGAIQRFGMECVEPMVLRTRFVQVCG